MSAPTTTASTQPGPGTGSAPHGLAPALLGLEQALDASPDAGSWRWTVRQRMAAVRDALLADVDGTDDGWLVARSGGILRDRDVLLTRLSVLGRDVLESPGVERVRTDLRRLATDLGHYVQRLHDLAYDAVELELGGSE